MHDRDNRRHRASLPWPGCAYHHQIRGRPHTGARCLTYGRTGSVERDSAASGRAIDVFLADDNLIVRKADRRVVGVAADYEGVVGGCAATEPQVLVTDVRMPPSFRREGIDAA